ncbi:phage tail protein [Clostridium sp. Marseille-Q7071]
MAEQFYSILTSIGKAKIANASVFGTKLNLTTLALGDGNGKYYNPTESQEALVNEVWRGNVGAIATDSENSNWIVIETMIAGNVGGFFIREVGVLDDEGSLIAIGKYPETYKPIVSDGATKDLIIRMILEVSNASSVTLKIDPTSVIATKKDIEILDNKIKNIKIPVTKVNNKLGDVTLKAEDIKANNDKTIEESLEEVTSLMADMAYKVAGGTATAIILNTPTLVDGYSKTFIVFLNNNGTSTTINGKPLYKPNTTTSPNLIAGKAATVWYSSTNNCFFIKASAEGNADVANVLAGKTFSNDNDTGIVGTMPNRGSLSQTLTTQGGQYNLPNGYYSGGYVKAQFPNLISSNIKNGINIGGVVGSYGLVAGTGNWFSSVLKKASINDYELINDQAYYRHRIKLGFSGSVRFIFEIEGYITNEFKSLQVWVTIKRNGIFYDRKGTTVYRGPSDRATSSTVYMDVNVTGNDEDTYLLEVEPVGDRLGTVNFSIGVNLPIITKV